MATWRRSIETLLPDMGLDIDKEIAMLKHSDTFLSGFCKMEGTT